MIRTRTLRRTLLAGLLMLALWPAAAAHAVGEGLGWSAPDYLSPDGTAGMAPSIATLADGTPVALWAQSGVGGFFPVVASKPIAASWSPPSPISGEPIDGPNAYSFGPRFAVTPNGQFVAAWFKTRSQLIAGSPTNVPIIEGATGTIAAGAAPGYTPRLYADADAPHGHSFSYTPRVFMTPEGKGVVAYPYRAGIGDTFLGLTGLNGALPLGTPGLAQSSLPTFLQGGSNSDDTATISSFAIPPRTEPWLSSAGDVMATITTSPAYVSNGIPPESALLSTTTDPTSWPRPQALPLPLHGFGASVGVLASGQVIVTGPSGDGRLLLWRAGDASPTTIDPESGVLQNQAAIATSWDGSATIAYQAIDSGSGAIRIREVTLSPTGIASQPITLSSADATARIPQAAYAPDGTAYVVWGQRALAGGDGPGTVTGIDSAYRLSDGDFSTTPVTVIHGLTDVGPVRVAVSGDGFVTLAAQIHTGAAWRVAAFEHANPAVPKSLEPPTITANGAIGVGTVLTCTRGTWTASPTSFRFEWLLDGTSLGTPSDGATHTVVAREAGHALRCRVTASNQSGSGQAESAAVTPGAASANAGSATPRVSAVRSNGDTVTVTLSCPASAAACETLTVQLLLPAARGASIAKAKPRHAKGRGHKPAATVLGSLTVKLQPGQTRRVTVRLNRAGRKLLARRRQLRARVQVSAGRKVLSTKPVTLRASQPRRHRAPAHRRR